MTEGDPADRFWVLTEGRFLSPADGSKVCKWQCRLPLSRQRPVQRVGGFAGACGPCGAWSAGFAGAGFGHAAARLWDFRLYNLQRFPSTVSPAGEVVALYHFKEAERIEGPAVVGESVLLQVRAAQGQGLS